VAFIGKHISIVFSVLILLTPQLTSAQKLIPGDGVRLTFYNVGEIITGDYFVQQDGILQLPYAGILQATDKDYKVLKSVILVKYDSLFRDVELIISPLYRIKVLGEVGAPGVYYATGVEKLLDMIAIAGGETQDSDMGEILLVRKEERIIFDAEEIMDGDNEILDFFVRSGDIIFVTRRWWVAGQNAAFLITAAAFLVTTFAVVTR